MLSRKLKCTIYRELLEAQRTDAAALEALWRTVPEADRQSPDIALEAARLFNEADAGLGALAVEAVEAALHRPPPEWDDSAQALLEEYGRARTSAPRDQLERVEAWIKDAPSAGPIRAALLYAAGMICLRQQLWGKSKAYLLESLAASREAATLLALARLADTIGDEREAAAYFKEAAVAFAAPTRPRTRFSAFVAYRPALIHARLTGGQGAPYLRARRHEHARSHMKLTSLSAFVAAIACGALMPAAAQTTIKLGYATTPTSHYGVGSNAFCEEVEKRTRGVTSASSFPAPRWAASAR